MAELNAGAAQLTGSLSQFKAVTEQLNTAARGLSETVSRVVV